MSFPGYALGNQVAQNDVARKQQLTDEQRQAQLANLAQSGLSPVDMQQGIKLLYQNDPSKLKEHVQALLAKLQGKQPPQAAPVAAAPTTGQQTPQIDIPGATLPASTPKTVSGPAPKTRQEALGNLAAKGKTAAQQNLEQTQGETSIADSSRLAFDQKEAAQKQQQTLDLIDKYVPDPELNKAAKEEYARKQAGIMASFKNIPGAGGQPYQDPNGLWVRPVQGADGSIVEQPMPGGWKPPAPKPSTTPKVGTSGGRNVYALLTPQGWVDAGTKQPLKDFRPLPTYAEIAPSLRPVQVVSETDPKATEYVSAPDAIKHHRQGTQSVEYKLEMPTGTMRGRAQLASSAREQLGDMVDILEKRSDLFGPGPGHITNFKVWVGSQDKDAQKFAAAARIAADHLAGVFGGRSKDALDNIYDIVGKNTTNPEAAIAGIQQMDKAAQNIARSGGGTKDLAPKKEQRKVGDKKKFANGKTGVWDGTGWVAQ